MKKKKMTLNQTEQEAIARAASAVWDEIGYDCLQATAEDLGQNINRVSIPRSQVIEIALDAGRLEERLKRRAHSGDTVVTTDLIARWQALDYEQRIAVAKRAFTYTRYGL